MILKKGSKGAIVKQWQKFVGAAPDGNFGVDTVQATRAFQAENNLREDGIVGDTTLSVAAQKGFKLENVAATKTGITTVLPASGTGFTTYNREPGGADQYGTARTIETIIRIAEKWNAIHPDTPIQYGDISRKNGGAFPPHASHRDGRDVDVRPFRKDKKLMAVTTGDIVYDSIRTEDFVNLVRREVPHATIYFNDARLITKKLTAYCKGHFNHLHIRIP